MKKPIIIVSSVVVLIALLFFAYQNFFKAKKVVVEAPAQIQKIDEYAVPESFISPMELKELFDNGKDVVVIGTLNPIKGDSPIIGSFTMWRDDYSAAKDVYPFGGMRNTREEMEAILSSYGATPESTIVTYAANAHHDAARLWWQIKLLGHSDVRFLDGGLNAWIGAGYPTGKGNPSVEQSDYKASAYSEKYLAVFSDIEAGLTDDAAVIIDTRGTDEENGSSTKAGAFGPGKIPGAVHINWTVANNDNTTLKSRAELEEIYGSVINGKNVITYCQSGVRSAHTLLVLTQVLGNDSVKNYDGSWIEWSYEFYENDNTSLPIENEKS